MLEGTLSGAAITTTGGVTVMGPLNLPSTMPEHASQLYAKNVQALLELMSADGGALALDFDDEIIAGACVTQKKEVPAS